MAIFRTAAVSMILASVVIAVLLLLLELRPAGPPREPVPALATPTVMATPSAISLEHRRDDDHDPPLPDVSVQVVDPQRSPVEVLIPSPTAIFAVSPQPVPSPGPTER